jgi:hypothetical protein
LAKAKRAYTSRSRGENRKNQRNRRGLWPINSDS